MITRPAEFANLIAGLRLAVSRHGAPGPEEDGGLMARETIREIQGPAGRTGGSCWSRRCCRLASRCAPPVVFVHPLPIEGGTMHTKVGVSGGEGARADRVRGAALQLPRRRHAATGAWDDGRWRDGRLPRGARLHGRRAIRTLALWAAGFSFGAWIALTGGAADDRVLRRSSASRRRSTATISSVVANEHEAEVLHPGRIRRDLPARSGCASSIRARARSRRSWS